ncbi:bifunctional precorrin-2 dehydrogenase/sirohydrochlorin ferrochelatase [Cohnella sp. CFH 77786]|uniref:precorrin-2 dehydrogenase/sirohydrochlorin ferrochelatase family protein n=1 Tax=Cohnella sp. CFH 77786 TaxID=2662265 RepID=UPI001C609294|nr:bifunctional precorrin-2 dehydrogenase/sirohydrochlorin ferrochelatase [Cohnella sp. CFH 77786]MBW5447840.1 bifunctional precorrin-2 dehydrogenase/sirohydrochlorin ferrochelatase [Cohnella sp. CFH 77786]
MAAWYPLLLDIEGKRCVVFGGGPVAERKIGGLLDAGARVRVVSPQLTSGLRRLADERRLEWLPKTAEASDLEGAVLAFAASGDPGANRRIAEEAKRAGIPVNVADEGETGDFICPAVLRRGRFVLAASASGAGPALASRVIRELSERYGPEYGEYAEALRRIRAVVKSYVKDPGERRRLLAAAADEAALREGLAEEASGPADPARLIERLRELAGRTGEDRDNR